MSLPDDRAGRSARVSASEQQIRAALGCGRSCCTRPRGKLHCPLHDAAAGGKPDLDVKTVGDKILVTCRVCGPEAQNELIAALQDRDLWPRRQADVVPPHARPDVQFAHQKQRERAKQADVVPLRPAPKAAATTRYELRDDAGGLVAIHPREDLENGDKRFMWWLPGAKKPGLNGRKPTSLPLYGTEHLKALPDGALVLVCEGERATDAARTLGFVAVGTVCGAASIPDDDALAPLVRLTSVLWADHDDPGHAHMRGIADRLVATGGTCYRFDPGTESKDDAADFLDRGGTREQLAALIEQLRPYDPHAERLAGLGLWSAERLYGTRFPEPRMIVPTLLPEGAALLVGRPKLGKSRLALNLTIAVASGGRALGSIAVEQGDVLALVLEDGARRTGGRAKSMAATPPPGLTFAFTWKRLDAGGLEDLDCWCLSHPATRLIVIDTAERIRPMSNGRQQLYREDYSFLAPLNDLALKHRVCILIVHHSNKADASDVLDSVSGSTGLTGAVDGTLVLKRERGRADATLHVVHRDLEHGEYALKDDQDVGSWVLLGDAEEYRLSTERAEIVNAVSAAGQPIGPKEVADLLGKRYHIIAKTMLRMSQSGALRTASYGKYALPSL